MIRSSMSHGAPGCSVSYSLPYIVAEEKHKGEHEEDDVENDENQRIIERAIHGFGRTGEAHLECGQIFPLDFDGVPILAGPSSALHELFFEIRIALFQAISRSMEAIKRGGG